MIVRTWGQVLRQRLRLYGHDARMSSDLQTLEQAAGATDQHLKQAVERVEAMMVAAQDDRQFGCELRYRLLDVGDNYSPSTRTP